MICNGLVLFCSQDKAGLDSERQHINAGHVQKLAEAEAEGAKEVDGVDVTLMQVNTSFQSPGHRCCPYITQESHLCLPRILFPSPSKTWMRLTSSHCTESRLCPPVRIAAFALSSPCMSMSGAVLPSFPPTGESISRDAVRAGAVQFPEILSDEILAKMHAAPKADVPVATVQDLPSYDGFIMGFPTRHALPCSWYRDGRQRS